VLFIFDWDGTLSDSASKIVRSMQRAADELGLPVPGDDEVRNIIGLGLPEAVQVLFPEMGADTLERLRSSYSRHYLEDPETHSPFFPGVLDTLESIREQGHRLAVATGKSRRGLDRVLQSFKLEKFFHGSRCADETMSKPHPMMLLELLQEFEVPAGECVMVGDTEYDMDMACRASMPRIAVSYGAHHIDRLKPFEPEMCLDHFPHILNWQVWRSEAGR
jgi:phosphoglycolate phosphatase